MCTYHPYVILKFKCLFSTAWAPKNQFFANVKVGKLPNLVT
jgi:hypothetical protein